MEDKAAQELLKFQVSKDISYLYKRLLGVMETVREDHFFMLEKLLKEIPEEYHDVIRAANHFDDNKFGFIRKKILDAGNEAIRNSDAQVGKFHVSLR